MTITLTDSDSVVQIDTGTHPHGSVRPTSYDASRVRQQWFGVNGEITLTGGLSGRNLSCWIILKGFASHGLLHAAIANLDGLINTAGTLDVDGLEFLYVLFEGFEPDEDPWYDASGVNGWQVKGMLKFRQSVSA
jgi:hypothetical protein